MLNEKEPIGIAQAITPSAARSIVGRHYEAVLWTNPSRRRHHDSRAWFNS